MQIIADLHTHTIASTHAFGTRQEMIQGAEALGLLALAITDHTPAMPDAPHPWYFDSILRMPHTMASGFKVLHGAECNVLGPDGAIDLDEGLLGALDWAIASAHGSVYGPGSEDEATEMWLKVAQNPLIDMIGHPEERKHRFDYDRVCRAFAEQGKVVEVNGNSPNVRKGNEETFRSLIEACRRHDVMLAVNSDAHSVCQLGNYAWAVEYLEEFGYPEELVVNSSLERLAAVLALHGKSLA